MGPLPSSWDLSKFRSKAGSFTATYRPALNRHPIRLMDLSNHYDESAADTDISLLHPRGA
jgi:hypothetical protein